MDLFSPVQDSKLQGIHVQSKYIPRFKRWFGPHKLSQFYYLTFLRIMRQMRQKLPKWWTNCKFFADYAWMNPLGDMLRNARRCDYCIQNEQVSIQISGRRLIEYYEHWVELLSTDTHPKSLRKHVRKFLKLGLTMTSLQAASCRRRGQIQCEFHGYHECENEERDRSDDHLISKRQLDSYKRLDVVNISKPAYKWLYEP